MRTSRDHAPFGVELAGIALALGACTAFILLSALYYGWALSILWRWFFVPYLGLPLLTIGQAIGISLTIGFLVHSGSETHEKDQKALWSRWALRPVVALGVGWLVKLVWGV